MTTEKEVVEEGMKGREDEGSERGEERREGDN